MEGGNRKINLSPYNAEITMRDVRARYRANRLPRDGLLQELLGLRLPALTTQTNVCYTISRDELRMEVRDELGRNTTVRFTIGDVSEVDIFKKFLVFRENPYLVVQATQTSKCVRDTLTRKHLPSSAPNRCNTMNMNGYVVVATPQGLESGMRVRVSYRKSYLDKLEPVEWTLARQRADSTTTSSLRRTTTCPTSPSGHRKMPECLTRRLESQGRWQVLTEKREKIAKLEEKEKKLMGNTKKNSPTF